MKQELKEWEEEEEEEEQTAELREKRSKVSAPRRKEKQKIKKRAWSFDQIYFLQTETCSMKSNWQQELSYISYISQEILRFNSDQ